MRPSDDLVEGEQGNGVGKRRLLELVEGGHHAHANLLQPLQR